MRYSLLNSKNMLEMAVLDAAQAMEIHLLPSIFMLMRIGYIKNL
jgi:hypothetical protein